MKAATLPSWACQFCRNGLHRSCPGAVRTPKGLLLCICAAQQAGHPARPRCLDCHQSDPTELDAHKWVCLDQYGCAARVQARKEANPTWRMVRACQVAAVNSRRRQKDLTDRIRATLPDNEDALYDTPVVRKTPKPRSGNCLCCGEPTKGGRFRPGHDARFRARLLAAILGGSPDESNQAKTKMIELGWGTHR